MQRHRDHRHAVGKQREPIDDVLAAVLGYGRNNLRVAFDVSQEFVELGDVAGRVHLGMNPCRQILHDGDSAGFRPTEAATPDDDFDGVWMRRTAVRSGKQPHEAWNAPCPQPAGILADAAPTHGPPSQRVELQSPRVSAQVSLESRASAFVRDHVNNARVSTKQCPNQLADQIEVADLGHTKHGAVDPHVRRRRGCGR